MPISMAVFEPDTFERYSFELSGGQRQGPETLRTAMATAIDPAIPSHGGTTWLGKPGRFFGRHTTLWLPRIAPFSAGAIFATELIERVGKGDGAGEVAESGFKVRPHMLRLPAGECRPRHPGNPGLDGA